MLLRQEQRDWGKHPATPQDSSGDTPLRLRVTQHWGWRPGHGYSHHEKQMPVALCFFEDSISLHVAPIPREGCDQLTLWVQHHGMGHELL